MDLRALVSMLALLLAGWGHVLLNDLFGARDAWDRLDGVFPAAMRSPAPVAGMSLLLLGAAGVLLTIAG